MSNCHHTHCQMMYPQHHHRLPSRSGFHQFHQCESEHYPTDERMNDGTTPETQYPVHICQPLLTVIILCRKDDAGVSG